MLGLIPGIFAFAQFDALRAFLTGIGKSHIAMTVQIITLLLHYGLSYILIFTYKLNMVGAGLAFSVTHILNYLLTRLALSFESEASSAL